MSGGGTEAALFATVDRFEGACAICERADRTMFRLPRALLPAGCVEGSRLRIADDGVYLVDNRADRARIEEKLRRLTGDR